MFWCQERNRPQKGILGNVPGDKTRRKGSLSRVYTAGGPYLPVSVQFLLFYPAAGHGDDTLRRQDRHLSISSRLHPQISPCRGPQAINAWGWVLRGLVYPAVWRYCSCPCGDQVVPSSPTNSQR